MQIHINSTGHHERHQMGGGSYGAVARSLSPAYRPHLSVALSISPSPTRRECVATTALHGRVRGLAGRQLVPNPTVASKPMSCAPHTHLAGLSPSLSCSLPGSSCRRPCSSRKRQRGHAPPCLAGLSPSLSCSLPRSIHCLPYSSQKRQRRCTPP